MMKNHLKMTMTYIKKGEKSIIKEDSGRRRFNVYRQLELFVLSRFRYMVVKIIFTEDERVRCKARKEVV